MKVWNVIFNFIAVFVIILLLPCYYNVSKAFDKEFDQLLLDASVDKATKAMMMTATSIDNIELDYINPDAIILSPGSCIDTFDTVMCYCYGMEPTSENKSMIENSVAAMVLSDEYGYYVAELVEDDITPNIINNSLSSDEEKLKEDLKTGIRGGDYTLRWGIRNPYTYHEYDADNNITKTFTLSYNYLPLMEYSNSNFKLTKTKIDRDDRAIEKQILSVINSNITDSIEAEILRRNSSNNFDFKFYLPAETTKLGVNPIKSPSALVFLNNASYASKYKIDAVNVGGYRVRNKQYIVCFENSRGKWYCYSNQLPKEEYGNIFNYVETMKEACDEGCAPYIEYLMNARDD